MSENPISPLLGEERTEQSRPERPLSQRSKHSAQSNASQGSDHSAESTPLLSRDIDHRNYNSTPRNDDEASSAAASSLRSLRNGDSSKGKKSRRWPTAVALTLLSLVVIAILGLGFAAPEVVEEYVKQAMVFEPTGLSIDSFTPSGVKARIQGDFMLDASKVQKKPVRDLGLVGTWIAKAVESKRSRVKVYLPEYGNMLLGTADVPPIVVDVRNGHTTHIDFLSDLAAGDIAGIRQIAYDWLAGRVGQLRVIGVADVDLKSGIFGIGTQRLTQELLFKEKDIPIFPQYNITRLNFRETESPDFEKGMAADVSLTLSNQYPVKFTIPPLGFDILVQGCAPEESYLMLARATTHEVAIEPKEEINVNVGGVIRQLPETLTKTCPNTLRSPLDALLGDYIHGAETTVYVRGSDHPLPDTPSWITELTKDVVVPLPFPGHTFDRLIRNFSLTDVHFGLPDPMAKPDSPQGKPRISAVVKVLAGLPKEMNFPISVGRVKANADVYYHTKKLGDLDLNKWQKANSSRIEAHGDQDAGIAVDSVVEDAPLDITDNSVFTEVVRALIFGGKPVILGVKADVDVETKTALGKFVVRDIPAEGKVFVKPISGGQLAGFSPKVGSLEILETTASTLTIQARMNITNPTEYSATVPYVNINLLSNGTVLGHATARKVAVVPGPNHGILVTALWDPKTPSGEKGLAVGRQLLSQYISGFNTTLTLKTHNGTIPTQPSLGEALSSLQIEIPTPKLTPPKNPNHLPGDDDDDDDEDRAPHFIDDATMHLFTSTATLTLLSPLPHSILYLTYINATAYYTPPVPSKTPSSPSDPSEPSDPDLPPDQETYPVGRILYDLPFAVPPGASTTPRLPVRWSLGSVGYEAVRQALGGTLRLSARAVVGVRVGAWGERVWFEGGGIGARVRI